MSAGTSSSGELAKNALLVLLVVLSLVLNRQLWMVDTGLGGEPAFSPPALTGDPPREAFHPGVMYLHLGSGEHARLTPGDATFDSLWSSTVALIAGIDRGDLQMLTPPTAEARLGERMAGSVGWGARFAAALPLDWWWEVWRGELDREPFTATPAVLPSLLAPEGPDMEDAVERALVGVDRISVFFEDSTTLSVFMGDGQSWLVAGLAVDVDSAADIVNLPAMMPGLSRHLEIYRGVPPEWNGVSISKSVLVPDQDIHRPLFLYLDTPPPPAWEAIKSFFLDHQAIREVTLNGLLGYTDGRQAVRIYPSGAIGYLSGLTPSGGAPWSWTGALGEAAWYIDRHGGWPGGARVSGFSFPAGRDLDALAAAHLEDKLARGSEESEFLAGGPWPEQIWMDAGGMGLTLVPYVRGDMLVSPDPCLEVVVGGRGLLRYVRYLPVVSGSAGSSRTRTAFAAITDAIDHIDPDRRPGTMVTGVQPAYFLPSLTKGATHLTAVWVVSLACGEQMFIHATSGNLLGVR